MFFTWNFLDWCVYDLNIPLPVFEDLRGQLVQKYMSLRFCKFQKNPSGYGGKYKRLSTDMVSKIQSQYLPCTKVNYFTCLKAVVLLLQKIAALLHEHTFGKQ